MLLQTNSKASRWIDQFQQKLSVPVATKVAQFARVQVSSLQQLLMAGSSNKLLMVVPGPFNLEYDMSYTWWHGFKVVVHNYEAASVLCRLNSQGHGGFYSVKLWYIHQQKYIYYGDPSQERQVKPYWVVRLINEHLANQYHIGFVEDQGKAKKPPIKPTQNFTEEEIKQWAAMTKPRM